MINWNNLDTLTSFKELSEVERVNLAEVMSGANGAERVKDYSVPMTEDLTYNYAAKAVDDKVLAALAKLAKEAERAGATAVSSVPPFYYNFKLEELVRYYTAISDATTLPVMVYNIPRYSGVIRQGLVLTASQPLASSRLSGVGTSAV